MIMFIVHGNLKAFIIVSPSNIANSVISDNSSVKAFSFKYSFHAAVWHVSTLADT